MLHIIKILLLNFLIKLSTSVIIDLPDGQVEGLTDTTLAGTKYHSFLALRYAQPPVGPSRFKLAQPVQPWQGIYDGTVEKHVCYQVYSNSDKENEDCLFLNVFTPANLSAATSNFAVMVFIHGGGFISGAAYMIEGGAGPKFFMDANVVFVTLNYRLGPFGFMSSGDTVLPGNLGLKDQVLALKWIQKNIAYFGGDPRKVTIFGQSAGSASVAYQLLSAKSKGLYRAAILESGSALSPWAYQRYQTEITYKTAQIIDPSFTSRNSTELLQFLMSVPASAIDNASQIFSSSSESPADYQISKGFFYAPVIEPAHEDAFLSEPQWELFQSGNYNKVPVFMGMTDEESLLLLANGDLSGLWNAYDEDPRVLVPFDLHVNSSDSEKAAIGAEIRNFFTNNAGFNGDYAKGIMYHSVHDFDKANIKQAELMSQHSTVYFYEFSYKGPMGYYNYSVPGAGKVSHAEEVNYLFSKWYSNAIPDNTNMAYFPESDRTVHYRIMSLWTNFAKYLNPNPTGIDTDILQNLTWTPVKPNAFNYLNIGKDLVLVDGFPKQEKYLFWDGLFKKYAVPPLDTF